jgi:hypothetical protein
MPYGFEVKLNGNLICRAGLEQDHYVMSCIVDAIMRKDNGVERLHLNIGGLDSIKNQHVRWFQDTLQENDEVHIKVITDNFDNPPIVYPQDADEFVLERKIEYYHKLKEELKDHLNE